MADKVALVTGANTGIGLAIARRLPSPTTRVVEDADDRWVAPRQHPGNPPRAPSIPRRRVLIHQHRIAMHGAAQGKGRDEDVARGVFRPHKAEAVTVESMVT